MLIDGEWVSATTAHTIRVYNPATGEVVDDIPAASAEDVATAIGAAYSAFPAWAHTPAIKRAELLDRSRSLLLSRREEIARSITEECGKPLRQSRGEINVAADFMRWYAEEGRRSYGEWIPDPLPDRRLLTIRQPIGVAAIITPWNFPAYMVARTATAALAAGCTVVIKPARQTPLTALALARAFNDGGIPPGVVNVVTGDASVIGQAFLEDQRVRKISFAGSPDVGKLLMRGAANHVKRVSLELGGHAAFIIMSDAALDRAIDGLMSAKFQNAGQTCIAPNHVYVHSSLLETFLKLLASRVERLKVGNGLDPETDVGPLINQDALEKVSSHVNDAIDHGARLLMGGHQLTADDQAKGNFYAPTILADVAPQMRITREETFGPVIAVTTFESDDEAIDRANSTQYGLAAYIYTHDLSKAIRIAERLDVGMVGVNDTRIAAVEAPFGGVKLSGIGREGGREGLAAFTETKQLAFRIEPA
jgi:succinate-semialdehyde dehydrogenase/glutarate-semialdehyde dehydrogenase